MTQSLDSFKCRKKLKVGTKTYYYYSLKEAEANGLKGISNLPFSLKVLLENLLRFEDGRTVTKDDIMAVSKWLSNKGKTEREIAFRPARVLMQDFTGVPAVVDLAAMRDAMTKLGGNPQKINPLVPVDLVIDHSVIVDEFGSAKAFKKNVDLEYSRNGERYRFLKWGQDSFDNFRVVPPGTGICHQVNLEYLSQTVWTRKEKIKNATGKTETVEVAYPDSLVGTGIKVMVVRPGFVKTKMTEGMDAAPFSTTPEKVAELICDGIAKGKEVVWAPGLLKFLFFGFTNLPRAVWRKVSDR